MDYFHLCAGQDTMEQISVLGLAHLGDGVYELMVRAWLCLHGKATNKGLHRAAVTYVSAPAQAQRAQKILPVLTQEEQDGIFRYLVEGGDLSLYGLTNAVTRMSQDVDSYDRATALEWIGWQVMQRRELYV